MTTNEAQADLRRSFLNGGPGAIISGLVWLAAGSVWLQGGLTAGFVTLFFGGFLIYPLSVLACRFGFRRPATMKGNPGGVLVMETLPCMIGGLALAWLLIPSHPGWVFAIAAFAVGAHYFPFRTAYGHVLFLVLAAALCAAGVVAILYGVLTAPGVLAFTVAGIEIVFGLVLTMQALSASDHSVTPTPAEKA